jgi:hypothetical protein
MDSSISTVDWMAGYMAWTNADSWIFGRDRLAPPVHGNARFDRGVHFATAYLDWSDSWLPSRASSYRDPSAVSARHAYGIEVVEGEMELLWDAFMVAAHTDSDCMPFLRQMINAANATPPEAIAA